MSQIKKTGLFFVFDGHAIATLIRDDLVQFIPDIKTKPVHEYSEVLYKNKKLIMTRDLNNGFTFKGEYLLETFADWASALSRVVGLVGPVQYQMPHLVLHFGDIVPHQDRRAYSLNIGVYNSEKYQVNVYAVNKSEIANSLNYGFGESIILNTRQVHSVTNISGECPRAFLVFTPVNDIGDLFKDTGAF